MKFFTRAWLHGELTEKEDESTYENYHRYIDSLKLPQSILNLSKLNIHDAYVVSVKHLSTKDVLVLRLRCGDLQVGYYDLTFKFYDYEANTYDLAFLELAMQSRSLKQAVEALHDEIDRINKKFEYRIAFWPAGEVAIRFGEVEISKRRVKSRKSR